MIFKSWVKLREALSQGGSLPRAASSSYFAQDQKMDDRVFPFAPTDSNLDPAKNKAFDEVKNMLVGRGLWSKDNDGIIGELDRLLVNNLIRINKYSEVKKTNDIVVLEKIVDLYFHEFVKTIESRIDSLKHNVKLEDEITDSISSWVKGLMEKYIPVLRGLEEAKLKILSITGKEDQYVGDGDIRRSNMYTTQIKYIMKKFSTY
jgi:hypothetical protein